MEQENLFDRIHEALDAEPRPGAYERLRAALIKSPARAQRRPALQMRWSKMGFKLAAGLAVVALAIAISAAILVRHSARLEACLPARENRSTLTRR